MTQFLHLFVDGRVLLDERVQMCIRDSAQGEQLGFVFPVYNYTTPPIIDAFLKRARFRTGNKETFTPDYCFAVISCGAFVGSTARVFGCLLYTSCFT